MSRPHCQHTGMTLNRAEELLLCSIRESSPAAPHARVRELLAAADSELDAVWQLADRQQVSPLLARAWSSDEVTDGIRPEDLSRARAIRLQTLLRNLSLQAELERIGAILHGHGIPVVPLKGTALAQRLFGALDSRLCGDIDILVPEGCLSDALDALHRDGYRPADGVKPGVRMHAFHGLPLLRTHNGQLYILEVHWKLSDPRLIDVDYRALWERVFAESSSTEHLRPLPNEEQLLFLAIHLPKHSTGQLKLLADIDRLIRHEDQQIDWERLAVLSERWQALELLYFALQRANELLETPLPEIVHDGPLRTAWSRLVTKHLAGATTILRPTTVLHLQDNRCRLAYCLLLTPASRRAQAYWRYFLHPPSPVVAGRAHASIESVSSAIAGLSWTAVVIGAALRDSWRRP